MVIFTQPLHCDEFQSLSEFLVAPLLSVVVVSVPVENRGLAGNRGLVLEESAISCQSAILILPTTLNGVTTGFLTSAVMKVSPYHSNVTRVYYNGITSYVEDIYT